MTTTQHQIEGTTFDIVHTRKSNRLPNTRAQRILARLGMSREMQRYVGTRTIAQAVAEAKGSEGKRFLTSLADRMEVHGLISYDVFHNVCFADTCVKMRTLFGELPTQARFEDSLPRVTNYERACRRYDAKLSAQ